MIIYDLDKLFREEICLVFGSLPFSLLPKSARAFAFSTTPDCCYGYFIKLNLRGIFFTALSFE